MNLNFRTALGEILREKRHELGLNLRQVSSKGFVALGYLSEVERGQKDASSETLEAIAQGLGVEVYELVIEAGLRMSNTPTAQKVFSLGTPIGQSNTPTSHSPDSLKLKAPKQIAWGFCFARFFYAVRLYLFFVQEFRHERFWFAKCRWQGIVSNYQRKGTECPATIQRGQCVGQVSTPRTIQVFSIAPSVMMNTR